MNNFDPDKLNYGGLNSTGLKKSDFTEEQLAGFSFNGSKSFLSMNSLSTYKFQPKTGFAFGAFFAMFMLLFVLMIVGRESSLGTLAGALMWPLLIVGFIILLVIGLLSAYKQRLKLLKFVIDNGIKYSASGQVPQGPIMFNQGDSRSVWSELEFSPGVKLATYQYVTGSGKDKQTHLLDFASFRLSRAVPHIYLNGRQNFISASVFQYEVQKLNLEGDFNKYFALYAPPNYQIDVLQIFTPDVMAVLMDIGKYYDYELFNDTLYVYGKPGSANSEVELRKMLGSLQSVASQIDKQARSYSDTRAGNVASGAVAAEGATLKRRNPTWAVIVAIFTFVLFVSGSITGWDSAGVLFNLFVALIILIPMVAIFMYRRQKGDK